MEINEYLYKHQPIIYNTVANAIEKDQLSHAYLLSGSPGMPLRETALYIAKSIVCEDRSPLACNHCLTCLRIDEGNYMDIKVIGGEKSRIKKEEVQDIISTFSNTANENAGKVIYVINFVETMTIEAVNSLLKFLEEPTKDVYAILTTENEAKVLPTILSRTQILKMRAIDRDRIIDMAKESGVSNEDAELLSNIYNDSETILRYSQEDSYLSLKNNVNALLNALSESPDEALYVLDKTISGQIKTQDAAKIFLSLLGTYFQDILNASYKTEITLKSYDNIIIDLSKKLKHIAYSLRAILAAKNKLEINVNIPLLLDHVIFEITREDI